MTAPATVDGVTLDMKVDGKDLHLTLNNGRCDIRAGNEHLRLDGYRYARPPTDPPDMSEFQLGDGIFELTFKTSHSGTYTLFRHDGKINRGTFRLNVIAGQRDVVGYVIYDLDADGRFDRPTSTSTGEAGVAGATVYVDLNRNGKYDRREPRTFSDSTGRYTLSNLSTGYDQVIRCQAPRRWTALNPDDGSRRLDVLVGSHANATATFGLFRSNEPRPVTISGSVFNDANRDGKYDRALEGGEGATVWFDLDRDGIHDTREPSAQTDVRGDYVLTARVPIGTLVRCYSFTGFTQPGRGYYVVTTDGPQTNWNFGRRLADHV